MNDDREHEHVRDADGVALPQFPAGPIGDIQTFRERDELSSRLIFKRCEGAPGRCLWSPEGDQGRDGATGGDLLSGLGYRSPEDA